MAMTLRVRNTVATPIVSQRTLAKILAVYDPNPLKQMGIVGLSNRTGMTYSTTKRIISNPKLGFRNGGAGYYYDGKITSLELMDLVVELGPLEAIQVYCKCIELKLTVGDYRAKLAGSDVEPVKGPVGPVTIEESRELTPKARELYSSITMLPKVFGQLTTVILEKKTERYDKAIITLEDLITYIGELKNETVNDDS